MSEAMTNREIEDVLTSIRRLVAQEQRHTDGADTPAQPMRPASGRLILTQAQRIDAPAKAAQKAAQPGIVATVAKPASTQEAKEPVAAPSGPVPAPALSPAPDLRRLEATIAELEAAVSASGSVFEPDGGDTASGQPSNVTALYVKPSFVHSPPADEPVAGAAVSQAPTITAEPTPTNDDDNDDDDALFETVIDEAMLRALVAQIVREELQGQLGDRITLQVRKLVRSEIAKALDARNLI